MQSVKTVKASVRAVPGQAAVITRPQQFDVQLIEFREPAAGEVRVRIEGCGVCASNLPIWEGKPWFEYPLEPGAPGHEAWGRIDAVGKDVTELEPGDRVAMLSSHAFETRRIVEAARNADCLLGVDLSYSAIPAMKKVSELVESGELGKIFAVDAKFHNGYGPDKAWFRDFSLSGGGCVLDLGSHLLDLAATARFPTHRTSAKCIVRERKCAEEG